MIYYIWTIYKLKNTILFLNFNINRNKKALIKMEIDDSAKTSDINYSNLKLF